MATLSTTSHGAATPGIELAATVTDYIHLMAAAFWVGGLFGLALVLPSFSLIPLREMSVRSSWPSFHGFHSWPG